MAEEAVKTHVTSDVIDRAWDAVGIDLLPDLSTLPVLSKGLKRALLHTPSIVETEEDVAKELLEHEEIRKEEQTKRY